MVTTSTAAAVTSVYSSMSDVIIRVATLAASTAEVMTLDIPSPGNACSEQVIWLQSCVI